MAQSRARVKEQEKHIINYMSIYLLIVWLRLPRHLFLYVCFFATTMMAAKNFHAVVYDKKYCWPPLARRESWCKKCRSPANRKKAGFCAIAEELSAFIHRCIAGVTSNRGMEEKPL